MFNPYENVDFSSVEYISGISHNHVKTQTEFDDLHTNGIRHIAISNYYPSSPVYPLENYFTPYSGMIACPNAEHHNFGNPFGVTGRLHFNGLGSLCVSGSPQGDTPIGFGGVDWKIAIDTILSDLLYSDAGGITINHPTWTGLSAKDCCDILDYDNRILGVEFYNQSTEENYSKGWDLNLWDAILKTGRKCYGFSVPDHSHTNIIGKNIILSNPTVYDCLRAYRLGNFYGKVGNTDFKFTSIHYENSILSVSVNSTANIRIITDNGIEVITGTSATKEIDANDYIYARIEAETENDKIYSNPLRFNKPGVPIQSDEKSFAVNFAHYFNP